MSPNEIAEILSRLDALEARCLKSERMLWLIVGLGIGTGALGLTQLAGGL